ncbi:ParB-like nuclease domain protein [Pseudomonas phage hairong]|nr:ParB-like nuclease domain protein [Pseudomonas phage hairong]
MENIGDIWGGGHEPVASKINAVEERTLKVMQQAAWSWLIDTVDREYTRLTTAGMAMHFASGTLRGYLGIKIMDWEDVMNKLPIIPPNFRDNIFDIKAKMEQFS